MSGNIESIKMRMDENEADKLHKLKAKLVSSSAMASEQTKRPALGELQNRAVLRNVNLNSKEAVQKDLKSLLRNTKPRVDSYWKKPSTNTSNGTQPTQATTATSNLASKILTRSNSLRLSGSATNNATNSLVQRTQAAAAGLQQQQQQQKTKTVTTKLVENTNKLQQVKVVKAKTTKTTGTGEVQAASLALKREDSSLSKRSLSKLKALTREAAPKLSASTGNYKAATTMILKKSSKSEQVKAPAAVVPSKNALKTVASVTEYEIVHVPHSHSTKMLEDVEDIDAGDEENLILVSEYANDIYDYLYMLEEEQAIKKDHLQKQVEVFPKMRAVLVDWINEVHFQFRLAPETYQMAVAIIDMYLQKVNDTKRSMLQLVGVTALFLASKYEELFPPVLRDFVFITDDTYTSAQILEMELKIFRTLDCNLSRPLPIHFLRRFSKAAKAKDRHHSMAKYFLELSSVEYDMAHYKPSELAAASMFLTLHLLQGDTTKANGFDDSLWTATLEWYSRYGPDHLKPIACRIANLANNAPNAKLKAVYTKYQSSKFDKISLAPELYSKYMTSLTGWAKAQETQ